MTPELAELGLVLAGAGVVAGVLAGLFGIGGGTVLVPAILFALVAESYPFEITTHVAVATSLAVIVPTGISSARAHHKRGGVDWSIVRRWVPGLALGAVAGGAIAQQASPTSLRALFAVIVLLVAARLLTKAALDFGRALPESAFTNGLMAFGISGVSAAMGAGGGGLTVPTLLGFRVPAQRAVGTASANGIFIALVGCLTFALTAPTPEAAPPGTVGYLNVPAALVLGVVTPLAAPVGAVLAHRLPPKLLQRAFAAYLLIIATLMLRPIVSAWVAP